MATTQEKTLITLESINPKELPEFQGWKEKQELLVSENPFIEIVDNKTFDEAKKRRTALLKGRTTIQSQDKLIASKIKSFRTKVGDVSTELISITLPHEEKQQAEVKRYEEKKAEEKAEKKRIEQERIQLIKNSISEYYNNWNSIIDSLEIKTIESTKKAFQESQNDTDRFEEFDIDFLEKVQQLQNQFSEKEKFLLEQEAQKKEREKFEKEKAEFEASQKLAEEKAKKEREALEKERLKKEKQLEADRKKNEEEKAKIEAEKKKLEDEKKAKEEAEKKVAEEKAKKEREEAERKRIETLKPDIEKLNNVISNIGIHMEAPEFSSQEASLFYTNLIAEIEDFKTSMRSLVESKVK